MQLNPAAFDAHLGNFAEPFTFRKYYACPCVNQATGSADPKCGACFGKGMLWMDPIDAHAAVASSSVQLAWSKMGNYEKGDLVLSIPESSELYRIAQFDRVTALTSTDQRSVVLKRGAPSERLHGTVTSVTRVFWLDANSKPVDGSLPLVAEDNTLSWPNGGAPPSGKQYSINYVRCVDYYAFGEFSSDRNKHGGLRLPRRMVLRRFDLLGRTPTGSAEN